MSSNTSFAFIAYGFDTSAIVSLNGCVVRFISSCTSFIDSDKPPVTKSTRPPSSKPLTPRILIPCSFIKSRIIFNSSSVNGSFISSALLLNKRGLIVGNLMSGFFAASRFIVLANILNGFVITPVLEILAHFG